MPAKFSQPVLDRNLAPYKTPFSIPVTSPRYGKNVSGRFGNYMEDKLGVSNKNKPGMADSTETELKTYSLNYGKSLTIAKITANEYANLATRFDRSVVFQKMIRTTLVTHYEWRGEDTLYQVKDGIICDLHRLDNLSLYDLEQDFQISTHWLKTQGMTKYLAENAFNSYFCESSSPIELVNELNYSSLGKGMRPPKTKYLTITWTGTSDKPQPTWKFKTNFVKVLTSWAANPAQDDYYQRQFVPA